MQPVDGVGGDLHGGVEAEGDLGGGEVVVDRLRHADDRDALAVELVGDAEGVLAADRDERVDALGLSVSLTRSTPPSTLYGFVRDVPSTVPPRGRVPRMKSTSSGSVRSSMTPRQPSRNPTSSSP